MTVTAPKQYTRFVSGVGSKQIVEKVRTRIDGKKCIETRRRSNVCAMVDVIVR
jgi:hypothetical protein